MPEIGESVQLYIQTKDEALGYIRGVNRLDGEENAKVQDPHNKLLETRYGKEMRLTPQVISFTADQGCLSMALDHQKGIEFKSSQAIKLYTEKSICSESQSLVMKAEDRIALKTSKTSIVIDDLIQMKS